MADRVDMSAPLSGTSRFSAEFELACLCCRVEPVVEEMVGLLGRVDTASFLELVLDRHRIGPLVHAALKRVPEAALPPALMPALSAATRANAVQALRAQRTLILLSRWFGQAGVTWLPFKGLTLAQRYYGEISLRHVNDLDIWVPGSELSRARAVLQEGGFHRDEEIRNWGLAERGPRHLDYLLRYYHEEHHDSAELGMLELHWRLSSTPSMFTLAPQQMLERAQTLDWGDERLRVLDDVDLLLYLCEHGGGHGWYRLKWLADLPRLLAHGPWDWPAVLERARSLACTPSLLLGLALCEELFGWVPPAVVRTELRRMRSLPFLRQGVRLALLSPSSVYAPGAVPSLGWRMRDLAKSLLMAATPGAVAGLLWRRALSPNDLRVLHVPDRWFGLYYLLRPLLFAWRYRRA